MQLIILNPFEEKKDYFATSILSESVNLIFDTEGRISLTKKLLQHSKIKNKNFICWFRQNFPNLGTNII